MTTASDGRPHVWHANMIGHYLEDLTEDNAHTIVDAVLAMEDTFPTRDIDNLEYLLKNGESIYEPLKLMLEDHVYPLEDSVHEYLTSLLFLVDEIEVCGITSEHAEMFKTLMEDINLTDEIRQKMDAFVARPGNDEFYAVFNPTYIRLFDWLNPPPLPVYNNI